jgi:hypothetical protein
MAEAQNSPTLLDEDPDVPSNMKRFVPLGTRLGEVSATSTEAERRSRK